MVVDNSQTDELGLPLVRGPFGSLAVAREAIERARSAGPVQSPLAERIRAARKGETRAPGKGVTPSESAEARGSRKPATPTEPEAPPGPRWLRDLSPARRRRAHELIDRLSKLGIAEAEDVARSEIVDGQPAVARLAIERRVQEAISSAKDPSSAVRAAIEAILAGGDDDFGAHWSLVDDQGRRLEGLEISD